MQDRERMQGSSGSHRPASFNAMLTNVAIWVGVGFIVLDAYFTVRRGINVFNTGDFLVNLAAAILWTGVCVLVQKAAFTVFTDPKSKKRFDTMWSAGFIGKLAVVILSAIAITAIHFSFSSTSVGLGINAQTLGINLPGQEYAASLGLIQLAISAFSGVTVAFLDEICFLCASIIKGNSDD